MRQCNKTVRFRMQWQAEVALRAIQRRPVTPEGKKPTGSYLCGSCMAWHLTSKGESQQPPWRHEPNGGR